MKKLILFLSAAFTTLSITASGQGYVWPVAGKQAGTDILYRPQEHLGNELVYDRLFIGGKEGDVVVSPVSGTISHVGVTYLIKLDYSVGITAEANKTMEQNIRDAKLDKSANPKYYSGIVCVRMADGNKVYIGGITGAKKFKTGQKIAAGDTLGTIGYSYKEIKTPSISVIFTNAKGQGIDPMSPFGLKSTFVKVKALTREDPMPADKIKEDLEVLKTAYRELYPSFGQSISRGEFTAYMDSLIQSVTGPIRVTMDFGMMLRGILNKLPDSHLAILPDPIEDHSTLWSPGEFLVACNDTVRVLIAPQGYSKYVGKVVTEINGRPAAEYAREAWKYISNHDGKVESQKQEEGVALGRYGALLNFDATKASVHKLVFADGSTASIPFQSESRFKPNEEYMKFARWYRLNRAMSYDDVFATRTLNDSTAYLAIKTFELMQEQVESIGDFLKNCKAKNLVVDVRNNGGGDSEVLNTLLSYFADAPLDKQKGGFLRVMVKGKVPILDYSSNYCGVDMFEDYFPGPFGYFKADTLETCSAIMPDRDIHYGGRVYVLTNGHSFSAATLFPAALVRNGRAVSVGRETGTTYHSMSALKFAEIHLPNTYRSFRMPLVQCVFDTTVNDRFPAGRGLLPDYPLPLSYKEIFCGADGKTDVMLEYALSLIAEGKYL